MGFSARRALSASTLACLTAWACSGCAPALNWREVRAASGSLTAWLPCKPDRQSRPIDVAGVRVPVEVLACTAEGSTWAITSADVGEAARVDPALVQLRQARSANLGGRELAATPAAVSGMTSSPQALRLRVTGVRPDGQAVMEESVLFAVGTRVFHAAVLGGTADPDALATFFGNLKIAR